MKTKEIGFTLPLAAVLAEVLFFRGHRLRRIVYLIPILVTMLIIPLGLLQSGVSLGVVGGFGEPGDGVTTPPTLTYLFTEFRVIMTYLRLLVLPVNQNLDYDYPITRTVFTFSTMLAMTLYAGLWFGAVMLARKRPAFALAVHQRLEERIRLARAAVGVAAGAEADAEAGDDSRRGRQ